MTVWLLFLISYFLLRRDLLLQSPTPQTWCGESRRAVPAAGAERRPCLQRAAECRSLRSASPPLCVTHHSEQQSTSLFCWDAECHLSNLARLLHKRLRNLYFELYGVFWKQKYKGRFAQPAAYSPVRPSVLLPRGLSLPALAALPASPG